MNKIQAEGPLMRNPLEQFRARIGLETDELARLLGVSPTTWRVLEKGLLRRSRVVWSALDRAGYDGRGLSRKHQTWLRLRERQSVSNPDAIAAG